MKSRFLRVVIGAAAVFAIASGVAYATGAVGQSAAVINACRVTASGTIRVVSDPSACKPNETPLAWNTEGPTGPPGAPGPQGPSGAPPAPHTQVVGQAMLDGLNGGQPFALTGYSWGASNTGDGSTGGGAGAGRAIVGDMTIVHGVTAVSPDLVEAAADGRHIRSAEVDVYAPGTTTVYMRYTLSDVLVTRVAHDGDEETVALSPATIEEHLVAGVPTPTLAHELGTVTLDGIPGTLGVAGSTFEVVNAGGAAGGGGAGKAVFKPLKIELALGAAAPELAQAVLAGRHLRSALVTMPHATYTLSDVLLPAVQETATGAAGSIPTQTVELSYSEVDVASR